MNKRTLLILSAAFAAVHAFAGDSTLVVDNVRVVAVPEPAAVVAILGGIAVLIGLQRRG